MGVAQFIHVLGGMGIFPSRAFMPAFATAMLLRFGNQIPAVAESGILKLVQAGPSWFTADVTLVILGILALIELIATKEASVREVLDEFDPYIKGGMAALTTLGFLSVTDAELAKRIHEAGFGDAVLATAVGGAVYFIATIRRSILEVLRDSDPDDDLGLQRFLSWLEDLWVGFGFLLLFLFPFVMLTLVALITACLYGIRRYIEYREDRAKVPCTQCQEPIYPCAVACPKCRHPVAEPRGIGFFGGSKPTPAPDAKMHPYDLVEKKRCPVCATRLPERSPLQKCPACGHVPLGEAAFEEGYVNRVAGRVPGVLLVSGLLGLIPVLGLIPGLIYYRFKIVAPFRRYVTSSVGCLVKWLVRLAIFFLIFLQLIPFVGALTLPLMGYLEYQAYRGFYRQAVRK
ncbi:MAG: DUF4126 family protein [Planctomycetes bacterium]|nr:DUF4126 family protein [Planctomycetota bacterium]